MALLTLWDRYRMRMPRENSVLGFHDMMEDYLRELHKEPNIRLPDANSLGHALKQYLLLRREVCRMHGSDSHLLKASF